MTQETAEKIKRYINGAMSTEEQIQFEAAVVNDPQLKRDVQLYLHETDPQPETTPPLASYAQPVPEALPPLRQRAQAPQKSLKWVKYVAGGIAAAIAIFFASRLWNAENSTAGGTDPLFTEYLPALQMDPIAAEDDSSVTNKAIGRYNMLNFTGAAELLEKDPAVKNDPDLGLVLANSYLMSNRHEAALALYRKLAELSKFHRNTARYYEALLYLKTGDRAACVEVLRTIPQEAGIYTRSQSLLKKLAAF